MRVTLLDSRLVPVGDGTVVRRLLPQRTRRSIGAWCFADHYGPDDVSGGPGMQVPPHPHTGLQTVSWLLDGEVLHRDSLGSEARVRPGEVSLMTSGWGISHSEESPDGKPPLLHGVQLWTALPADARDVDPSYEHHRDLPVLQHGDLTATLFLGEHAGEWAPGTTFSPLVGLDVAVAADGVLPLREGFEHGALVMDGEVVVDGTPLVPGALLDLGEGRTEVDVAGDGRLLLLGGEPLQEPLLMWWNFVVRSAEEVARARQDWATGDRFGEVRGYDGPRLEAPQLGPARLTPRS